jgi:hypothetical protein
MLYIPVIYDYDITAQKWSLESEVCVQSISSECHGVRQFFPLRRFWSRKARMAPYVRES